MIRFNLLARLGSRCLLWSGLGLVLLFGRRCEAATCFDATDGLVGWWPGDVGAEDIAGTNSGFLLGTAAIVGPGKVGAAFSFDGTDAWVGILDSPDLHPISLTVETWVSFSSLDSVGTSLPGDQYLVFKQNNSSNITAGSFEGFSLMKVRLANADRFKFQVSSPDGQTVSAVSLTTVSVGLWYHVVGVRGPDYIALYVNGQQEARTNVNFDQDYGPWPLYFGSTGQQGWDHKLAGLLDEVTLFSRVLSADEISTIYAAGSAGKCKGVQITVQPQSETVMAGSDVGLSVTAVGIGVISYQWQFNGVVLPGAVFSNLVLRSVQAAQAGNYSVIVTNRLGAVTSQVATVTVLLPDLTPVVGPVQTYLTGPPYPQFNLAWGVTNQGAGPVASDLSWSDAVYCSVNIALDGSAVMLSSKTVVGPLAVSGSYVQTNTQNILTLRWDRPALSNPAGYRFYQGTTSRVYDQTLDVGLSLTNRVSGLLPSSTNFFAVTAYDTNGLETPFSNELRFVVPEGVITPLTRSGTYYLIFQTDTQDTVPETNESNNTALVTITFTAMPADLAPIALLAPSPLVASPNMTVPFVWGVTNQGLGPTSWFWSDRMYLSTNPTLDLSAVPLFSTYEQFALPPGGTYWRTNSVMLPNLQSGRYYLILQTDAYNQLADSDYTNNTLSLPLDLVLQTPDLMPLSFAVPGVVTGPPNPKMLLSWGVTNEGPGTAIALPFWTDRVFFSTNAFVSPTDQPLLSSYEIGPMGPGVSYWRTNLTRIPVRESGLYYFIFQTDCDNKASESNLSNNELVMPVTFNVTPPDLMPIQLQAPSVVTGPPNPSVSISYVVTNQGLGEAIGSDYWFDQLYVSTNSVLDGTEQPIVLNGGWPESGPVQPSDSYARSRSVHIPVFQSGVYYLIFKVNAQHDLVESNQTNNVLSVPVSFNLQPADLAVLTLLGPAAANGPPFPIASFSWGVTNQGVGPVLIDQSWSDKVYLSRAPQLDSSAILISEFTEWGPLNSGAVYWRTNLLRLPVIENGNFYVLFQADAQNALFESVLSNNTLSVPITITILPPDLVPIDFLATNTFSGPPNPVLSFVWGVTNAGIGPAVPYPAWSDQLFFSTNPIVHWWDVPILSVSETGVVAAGETYWRTNTAQVPVVQSGTYYFIFQTDVNDSLVQSNPSNNTVVVPVAMTINPPDLHPFAFGVPMVVNDMPNPVTTVSWGVTNQGTGPAVGAWSSWKDTLYLSTRSERDGSEIVIGQWTEADTVESGAVYWRTNTVRVPVTQSGTYYLIFETDTDCSLAEASTNNNVVFVPVTFHLIEPLADSDGDGLTNMVESALGSDSFNPTDANDPIKIGITQDNTNHYLMMSFKRRANAAALQFQYLPEVSADKATWHAETNAVLPLSVTALDPQFDWVTVRDATPITSAAARFVRLRVLSGSIESTSPIWVGSDTLILGNNGPGSGVTLFSQRMVQPILSAGVVSSINSAHLIDTNAVFSTGQFGTNGLTYVEFDQGTMADIMGNNANTVALASNSGGLASEGDKYRIRAHFTIDTLFGSDNGAGLAAGPNPTLADQIILLIPQTQRTVTFFYYFNPSFTTFQGWVRADTFLPAGNQVIYPEQGVIIRRTLTNDINLFVCGPLKPGTTIVPIQPGYNLLGSLKSFTSVTLSNLNLFTGNSATGVVGGQNPSACDNLVVFRSGRSSTYFYYFNPGVYQGWVSANGFIPSGDVQISPGSAFFLVRQAPGPFNWTIPGE